MKSGKKTFKRITISGIIFVSAAIILSSSLGSCSVSYLSQAAAGHFRIMNSRKSIEKVLKNDKLDANIRDKLELVLDIREFAIRELNLPDNKSYTVYAEIKDQYPGWNVYCAPKLSLEPKTWCFPIAGCVVYHGYFKKKSALDFAEKMKEEGYDVYVSPFTAYSTLGWYKDPILSNHLRYDSVRLAELIIHEMAHQKFYVSGNSRVSESFAVTVERAGVLHWLKTQGREDQIASAIKSWDDEDLFIDKMLKTRNDLNEVYTSNIDSAGMLRMKDSILSLVEKDLFGNKRELNNANFIPLSTYHSLVPLFQSMLDSCKGNFSLFYESMEKFNK